jgi:anti-sigma B factor antagonist
MVLSITTRTCEPGITVIEVSGRITLGRERDQIEATVLKALNAGAERIVIDLKDVSYVDSSGIGVITYCYGKIAQKGAHCAVAGARGLVLDVFHLTRVDSVVPFYPDVESACAALANPAAAQPSSAKPAPSV